MIHILLSIILLVVHTHLPAQEILVERKLTLQQSVDTALNNRKEVLLAQHEQSLSKERTKEATSFKYPKIDLIFGYSMVDTDRPMVLPPHFGSALIDRKTPGDYYITRVSLWQHIYSGGRYSSNLKLAESNLYRSEMQLRIVTNDITFEVKKAFYRLFAIQQKIDVYNLLISSANELMKGVKQKKPADEIEGQRFIITMERERNVLINEKGKKSLDFLNTLGIELNTSFLLEQKFEPLPEKYDLNSLLGWAFKNRPEPKQIQAQEEIDALSLKLSMTMRHPTVSLGAHYESPGETLNFDRKNWNAMLNMDLPIFDGWASWSRIRQKHIQVEQNKLKRRDVEDSIRLGVRKTYQNYNFWLNEVNTRKSQLEEKAPLLLALNRLDLQSAISSLRLYLMLKLGYIDAVDEHLCSRAGIEHAIGKSLVTESIK